MRAVIAPDGHELGTYLRVDEVARRFEVSVEDVLAACSLLGFAATDRASLIEVATFTDAVRSAPSVRSATIKPLRQRRAAVLATGAAAALIAVVTAFVAFGSNPSRPTGNERLALSASATRAAAAYQRELKSTYEATVAEVPIATDYRALAQRLAEMEPPADYSAEHAELIAEAERVAELASSLSGCADVDCVGTEVSSAVETTTAADALKEHVDAVGAPTP